MYLHDIQTSFNAKKMMFPFVYVNVLCVGGFVIKKTIKSIIFIYCFIHVLVIWQVHHDEI